MHRHYFKTILGTTTTLLAGSLGYFAKNSEHDNNNEENNSMRNMMNVNHSFMIQAEDVQEHYFPFRSESEDLELIKVQIINRHGARTPINSLPNYIDSTPWKCLPFESISGLDYGKFNTIFEKDGLDLLGNCMKGQLTEAGAIQMFKVGEHLREVYFKKLFAIDGDKVMDYKDIINSMYVRSSDIRSRRTEFSLMYLLQGFLGSNQAYYPTIHMYEEARETLYGHFKVCAKLGGIISQRIKKLNEDGEHDAGLQDIKARLLDLFYANEKNIVEEQPQSQPPHEKGLLESKQIRQVRDFPQWESLNNAFAGMLFHGHSLPKGITEADYDYINKRVGASGFVLFGGMDLLRMNNGMLVKELVDSMKKSIDTSKDLDRRRLEIYLGHDTTLIPLLVTLNLYDGVWPPFASTLVFELYVNKLKRGQHFVKIVFNDKIMHFDAKDSIIQDAKSGLVPFEEFERILKPYMVNYKEWKELCKVNK
ncbi:acid phosphatase A domain-containing protein [Naegleria gruberi]|uniref:Acid phosphatase A domain-containing protein n=1 Tax=Naegleria gruberi TaxID=5762 RepID=D2VRX5_NAEGR|nr:acid phosphatase A domain-containing protein [Naegleria gruberi]EFC40539.1 acid phosphatase A domain-containing protein [Naegleria gruberi]|eukprot:XP_002673283.1 acid phosphatase A domain-containing protein [Naegleria gruberi strain NEG-M]